MTLARHLFTARIINLIDKDRIRGDEGFGDSRAVWRARLFFSDMAGGLAGSVVHNFFDIIPFPQDAFMRRCRLLVLKYANVSQSVALMLSAVVCGSLRTRAMSMNII